MNKYVGVSMKDIPAHMIDVGLTYERKISTGDFVRWTVVAIDKDNHGAYFKLQCIDCSADYKGSNQIGSLVTESSELFKKDDKKERVFVSMVRHEKGVLTTASTALRCLHCSEELVYSTLAMKLVCQTHGPVLPMTSNACNFCKSSLYRSYRNGVWYDTCEFHGEINPVKK